MLDLNGVCPILATPFTERGEVDFDGLRRLLRLLIAGGCHGVTLFGIAGEYYKLTEEESRAMIAIVVDECRAAGVPSVISITQHATECAVRQARYVERAGADCLMLLPPFFLKPSGSELYEHMKAVGQAVALPVMIQYAPEQTGVGVPPESFARLSEEVRNISYYKIECKPVGGYISKLLKLTKNRVKVFVGNAGFQMVEALERGAAGVMPGCSLFDIYLEIYQRQQARDHVGAVRRHNELLPLLNHIRQDVEMIIAYEKKILRRRGFIGSDDCRRPTAAIDEHHERLFDEYLAALAPLGNGVGEAS